MYFIYVHKAFYKHSKSLIWNANDIYCLAEFVLSGWTTQDSLVGHSATSSRAEGFNGKNHF